MSKVQIGMIGCGGMSGAHAHRLKANPDVQIVSVCDVNTEITGNYVENNLSGDRTAP